MEHLISLSFPIPLGLFIWIEVVVYRNYRKAVTKNPDKEIRSTVFWAFKTLLSALPPALLIILIESLASTLISYTPNYWEAIFYHRKVTAFIVLSLALGIPLGLIWGVAHAAYRKHRKSIAEHPERSLVSTVAMVSKSIMVVLLVLSLGICLLIFQEAGFEIFVYLALGWVPILFEQIFQLFQHWETVSIIGALTILMLIAFQGLMNWRYSKTSQPLAERKYYWKVSWTAGLAGTVILIFLSGFAFIGAIRHTAGITQEPIVQFKSFRAYDSDTKSNLHNVYLACKAYWADHGGDKSCERPIFTLTTYGYIQSSAVRIEATGGEENFRALATNTNNSHWFWVDSLGKIRPFTPSKEKS